MREKTTLKRRVNKEHNSNFRAGYVNINEEHLHKTGIRGRKQYIICSIMCIMLVIAVLNLLVSIGAPSKCKAGSISVTQFYLEYIV